ncbi:MAG: pyruvate kinase [Deltaproteobacteria bacterium]|nr:pyruvate kinase [Deltaproteobacteria bacterium]
MRLPATKIVCTIGPASESPSVIAELIRHGMSVARFNFSHGTHEWHARVIDAVRAEARRQGRHVAILQDLQGPKIRLGCFKGGKVVLQRGSDFTLTTGHVTGDESICGVDYAGLPADVRPGDRILLRDGAVRLAVRSVSGRNVRCRVVQGGAVGDRQGVNLPDGKVSLPSMTRKDRKDLAFGLGLGVDYVALSFVRSAEDVRKLVRAIRAAGKKVPVIAKLEKPQALENLDGILAAADSVMVARGDLGVETSLEEVPYLQRKIITAALAAGVTVITATQMLESMVGSPVPTRAEVSDVAHAVWDGTDAVMLSGETSVGKFPVKAVETMRKVVESAEPSMPPAPEELWRPYGTAGAVADAACRAAVALPAKAVVVFTRSGRSAAILAASRPSVPVVAFTPAPETAARMALYRGVEPMLLAEETEAKNMAGKAVRILRRLRRVAAGDPLVLVHGSKNAPCDQLRIITA